MPKSEKGKKFKESKSIRKNKTESDMTKSVKTLKLKKKKIQKINSIEENIEKLGIKKKKQLAQSPLPEKANKLSGFKKKGPKISTKDLESENSDLKLKNKKQKKHKNSEMVVKDNVPIQKKGNKKSGNEHTKHIDKNISKLKRKQEKVKKTLNGACDSSEESDTEHIKGNMKHKAVDSVPSDVFIPPKKMKLETTFVKKDPKKRSRNKTSEIPRLKVSSGFSWSEDFSLPTNKKEESSSDESDEEEEQKVEKTRYELRLEKKAEENKIYEIEKKRLEGNDEPQTADDFDRLVLQSPNSSIVWTRYMAYHLECTEIDKAREVAERALKTINFRDEQEKLNMWVAYLNLENMYGTSDQVDTLFDRAKENCDSKKIHQRMISIYVRSEKFEEAEQLHNLMVKRFNTDKQVWLNFVVFCFLNNRLDTGRKLLQRSFKSLDKREHIEMISKVAQMEIKNGDGERGKTMFENLLANYPKRLDLWSVYIDMVRIMGDFDGCRKLFERVLSLKVNAKRMRFIFKKYLDFENQFGTPENVASIREKALKYVESKGFYDEM